IALAIMLYFKRDVLSLFRGVAHIFQKKAHSVERYFAVNFIIATIASVILILVLKNTALEYGRSAQFIAFNLIFFGVVLYVSDRKRPADISMETSSRKKISLWVGLAQALAIFPGVSRSGITITAGRFSGLSRLE